MLHKSFLEKCASVDHRLSITISRSNIPSWFVEQQYGDNIRLKLPSKCHSKIKGLAVCALFSWASDIKDISPRISFTFINDGELVSESKFDHINASTTAMDNIVWVSYIPIKYFQRINDNWSHINEVGNHVINVEFMDYEPIVRCGAHIVYKEDVEEFKTNCVSVDDYWNMDCVTQEGNSFLYQDSAQNLNST